MTDQTFLQDFRHALGLSQDGMAEALGVSQGSYARWETGRRPIPERLSDDLTRIFARFLHDVQALRTGSPISSDTPWLRAARFWARQDELETGR